MRSGRLIYILAALVIFTFSGQQLMAQSTKTDSKALKLEQKADRSFIRGDYTRAMKTYEQAEERLSDDSPQKHSLAVKMARMYVLLQKPDEVVYYYDMVAARADELMTVNDVCFYVDALRQRDEMRKAEIVTRQFAFNAPFSRNQRYVNLLNSIATQRYYFNKGQADYGVELVQNGELPEYWIGEWQDNMFYAASKSPIQDPLKIYYHQTKYYMLEDGGELDKMKTIPLELQSGPVAFSRDNSLMVASGISYRKDRITELALDEGLFITQLYYSTIDQDGKRWSRFRPLFEHQEGYNYAHPTFFNNDTSIIFASDRPGGYGGMDLYVSHWNEASQAWSTPENMGPRVNTEGHEIYPRVEGDALYFSSNGLEGNGGYDIYRVSFGRNVVLPGSLFHFPYPINTAYNDFGLFFDYNNDGYFISDRAGMGTKDDIYRFDSSISALSSANVVGVSDEYSAMIGDLNQITGMKSVHTETFERDINVTPQYQLPQEGELLVTVYFDFNRYNLTRESIDKLNNLLGDRVLDYVDELHIIGYADDIGSAGYNKRLSERRAQTVETYLKRDGNEMPGMYVEGRGQISLTPAEFEAELQETLPYVGANNFEVSNASMLSLEDRVKINRTLRRVDIVVSKLK